MSVVAAHIKAVRKARAEKLQWRLIAKLACQTGLVWASNLLRRASGRKMIHVIGDSHALTFSRCTGFIVHHVGPATAYNLIKDNSTTQSKAIVLKLLDNIGINDRVLFIFGEIDCRIHIYNAYMSDKQAKPIEHYVAATVARYGKFLRLMQKERGLGFAVLTIPPAGYHGNRYKYPYIAPRKVQVEIHERFNEKLKLLCHENNIKYIDIYDKIVTSDGHIKRLYLQDYIHLSGDVTPFVIEELKKANMW